VGTLAAIGRARPVSDVTSYYLGLKQEGRERRNKLLPGTKARGARATADADV
jgi:hypothetical protein